jgi:hypothetical protein
MLDKYLRVIRKGEVVVLAKRKVGMHQDEEKRYRKSCVNDSFRAGDIIWW